MRGDMVQTLIQATGSNRSSEARDGKARGRAFITLLFAVIALFLLFLYAGTRIAQSSPDNFGTMVAGGCTIMIAFQAFLNIAMVIGGVPVVGKPLPFISSGGSSLVAMLIMVGIILSARYR